MHKPSNTLQQVKEWLEKRSRFPFETMKKWDALYYIQQLETRLAQVERERDAAIHDMVQIVHEVDDNACVWCKNAYFDELKCKECRFHNEGFEWQGVQPTNTKEE